VQSSLTVSIFNLTSDLCLPARTFSRIEQDMNSTFQFQVHLAGSIGFNADALLNISQRAQSKFSLLLVNTLDVHFDQQSINYVRQEDRSLLDIWIKYGKNLVFDDRSVQNIDIWRSSFMRIGFQYSSGRLQIATNAFSHINEGKFTARPTLFFLLLSDGRVLDMRVFVSGQGGELLFQIVNSTDFDFRFNRSIRLERVEILDRTLNDDDLCRIMNIPGHMPMKLPAEQTCSCPVFYLYRHLRHTLSPSNLKELVPACYSSMSLDQVELEQGRCAFEQRIAQCSTRDVRIRTELCQHRRQSRLGTRPSSSYLPSTLLVVCFLLATGLIYVLATHRRRSFIVDMIKRSSLMCQRQQRAMFSADSYQQLTTHVPDAHVDVDDEHDGTVARRVTPNKMMKIMVKYNSTTERTQPYLCRHSSDFVVSNDDNEREQTRHSLSNEDITLKLNNNPLSDIHVNH
jgi:hypothetical protein